MSRAEGPELIYSSIGKQASDGEPVKIALRNKARRRVIHAAIVPVPPPPPPPPLAIPANSSLPVITGLLGVGSVLTCSTGVWTNFPASYAYQWFEANAPVGTNANTYVSAVVGADIFCVVTATNSDGSGTATSASVGPIAGPAILLALTLSASSIVENSTAGTVVGVIQNTTGGSALSLSDTAGSRFAISGGNIVAGSVATNYENATTHSITIVETLSGATGSPKSTTLAIAVTNVFEQPDLGALTFSGTGVYTVGTTASGTIIGATATSTITASGLPSGLTINGGARTWAYDGTGSVSSGTFPLTETLSDSSNSPRISTISFTIQAAGSFATPTLTNFSALGAAPMVLEGSTTDYVAGYRGQLQIATDNAFTSIVQNQIFFIDGASWANDSVSTGINTPTGTYYARWRVCRDNESSVTTVTGNDPNANALSFAADVSPWSNTFTDTISVPSAVWNTTTGANKSSFVRISGSNLVVTGTATVGAACGVRSNTSTIGKRQFEVTWTTKPGSPTPDSMLIGVEAGSTTLNGSFPVPNPGVIYKGDGHIYKNGVVVQTVTACAQSDTVTCEFDTVAGTVSFYKNGATQIGTTVTGISFSNYYGYCATFQADVLTGNFGENLPWVHTPNPGYAGW